MGNLLTNWNYNHAYAEKQNKYIVQSGTNQGLYSPYHLAAVSEDHDQYYSQTLYL